MDKKFMGIGTILRKAGLDIHYEIYDANEIAVSNNIPVKGRQDCATRAIATLLDKPFSEILQMQFNIAMETGGLPSNHMAVLTVLMDEFGYSKFDFADHEIDDILIMEWLYNNPDCNCIICTTDHAICYKNHTIYDNMECNEEWYFANILSSVISVVFWKKGNHEVIELKGE